MTTERKTRKRDHVRDDDPMATPLRYAQRKGWARVYVPDLVPTEGLRELYRSDLSTSRRCISCGTKDYEVYSVVRDVGRELTIADLRAVCDPCWTDFWVKMWRNLRDEYTFADAWAMFEAGGVQTAYEAEKRGPVGALVGQEQLPGLNWNVL